MAVPPPKRGRWADHSAATAAAAAVAAPPAVLHRAGAGPMQPPPARGAAAAAEAPTAGETALQVQPALELCSSSGLAVHLQCVFVLMCCLVSACQQAWTSIAVFSLDDHTGGSPATSGTEVLSVVRTGTHGLVGVCRPRRDAGGPRPRRHGAAAPATCLSSMCR